MKASVGRLSLTKLHLKNRRFGLFFISHKKKMKGWLLRYSTWWSPTIGHLAPSGQVFVKTGKVLHPGKLKKTCESRLSTYGSFEGSIFPSKFERGLTNGPLSELLGLLDTQI